MKMLGMSLIVKTVTRIFWPILLLLAFYMAAFGHITPGGGFPGGAVLAGAFILSIISYGLFKGSQINYKSIKDLSYKSGMIIIIVFVWSVLFRLPIPKGIPGELFSASAIPLINIGICIMVGFKLATAFYALVYSNEKPEGDVH